AVSAILGRTSGRIVLGGRNIEGLPAHRVVAEGVAHLPEGRELFSGMTVVENLRLGGWANGSDEAATLSRIDEMFGLFARLRERASQAAGTLSGGEQQMLGVARALMSAPRLLLIDELSL